MRKISGKNINRVLDANLNRAKEGLRVCEDICRFDRDCESHTREYKRIRHMLTDSIAQLGLAKLIQARDIRKDVGRKSSSSEFKRRNVEDIFYANSQRVKESIRVMEEFAKLKDVRVAEKIKRLRYEVYALEQDVIR